ncbi:MAG: hypothetical protein AAGG08_10820 [Actinomycetota bacterium]
MIPSPTTTVTTLIPIALFLTACGSDTSEIATETATETLDETPAAPAGGFTLNGFRYCEILLEFELDDGSPLTEVWGSPGVGDCAVEAWDTLDPDAILAESGAVDIDMNGLRFFTVDGGFDTAATSGGSAEEPLRLRDYGDVTMRLLATIDDSLEVGEPYVPDLVVRTETFTYRAGTEIHELTDPDGEVYVMQSYSLIVDPTLTADDLAALGEQLVLPNGWSFASRVLDDDLVLDLTPDGAVVVTDEFRNAYQRNG